jgi:zinc transport system substrate-binding protein
MWRNGRPLARLPAIGGGIALGVVLLGAAMIAVLGSPVDRPSPTISTWCPTAGGEPLQTFAGIPPIAYLVEQIGGDYVDVEVLVQPGKDPHIFEPTPPQVIALSRARLFFRVGMPFEDRLIQRVAGGPARFTVVNTAAGIAPRASSCACEDADARPGPLSEGDPHPNPLPEGEGDYDPHVWLSPSLLKKMASNVAAALCQADPPHAKDYHANLDTLHKKLDELDQSIKQRLLPCHGQAFYVFHPAFGYFAGRYGLRQVSVEVEGKPPTPRQVFGLIAKARNDHVKVIFLQPQFNQQIAASVARAIGGTVKPMDDLAPDVMANLDHIADTIVASNREKTK